jgi:hypothetical protein
MEEGGPTVIMDLTITLDFACCSCDDPVSVTLQCSGKGLAGDQGQCALPSLWSRQSDIVRALRPGQERQTLPSRLAAACTLG